MADSLFPPQEVNKVHNYNSKPNKRPQTSKNKIQTRAQKTRTAECLCAPQTVDEIECSVMHQALQSGNSQMRLSQAQVAQRGFKGNRPLMSSFGSKLAGTGGFRLQKPRIMQSAFYNPARDTHTDNFDTHTSVQNNVIVNSNLSEMQTPQSGSGLNAQYEIVNETITGGTHTSQGSVQQQRNTVLTLQGHLSPEIDLVSTKQNSKKH